MASRTRSSGKNHQTQQKDRAGGERAKARASGGGVRNTPADAPAGLSASTGGRTTRGMARNDQNSRSSRSGRK